MQLGSTAIAICTKEGVILAVEKRLTSPLLVRNGKHVNMKNAAMFLWRILRPLTLLTHEVSLL